MSGQEVNEIGSGFSSGIVEPLVSTTREIGGCLVSHQKNPGGMLMNCHPIDFWFVTFMVRSLTFIQNL